MGAEGEAGVAALISENAELLKVLMRAEAGPEPAHAAAGGVSPPPLASTPQGMLAGREGPGTDGGPAAGPSPRAGGELQLEDLERDMRMGAAETMLGLLRAGLQEEIAEKTRLEARVRIQEQEVEVLKEQNQTLNQQLHQNSRTLTNKNETILVKYQQTAEHLQQVMSVNSRLRRKLQQRERALESSEAVRLRAEEELSRSEILAGTSFEASVIRHSPERAPVAVTEEPAPALSVSIAEAVAPLAEIQDLEIRSTAAEAEPSFQFQQLKDMLDSVNSKLAKAESARIDAASGAVALVSNGLSYSHMPQRLAFHTPYGPSAGPGPPPYAEDDDQLSEAIDVFQDTVSKYRLSPRDGFISSDSDEESRTRGKRKNRRGSKRHKDRKPSSRKPKRTPRAGFYEDQENEGLRSSPAKAKPGKRGSPARIQRKLGEIQAFREKVLKSLSLDGLRELAELELQETRLKRKLKKLMAAA